MSNAPQEQLPQEWMDRIESEMERITFKPSKVGYLLGANAYALRAYRAEREAERLRKALLKIESNILEQGPKDVAIDNRLHMIIYSALHTAKAALTPQTTTHE